MAEGDEEWDAVEWEDNDAPDGNSSPRTLASEPARLDPAFPHQETKTCAYSLDIDLADAAAAAPEEKSNKRKRAYVPSAEDKHFAVQMHREDLVDRLAMVSSMSCAANDPDLQAVLLSLVPNKLSSAVVNPSADNVETMRTYKALLEWFVQYFTVISDKHATEEEGRDGSEPAALLRAVRSRAGTAHQLVQIFVSVARALNVQARYVASVTLPPPVPSAYPQIKFMCTDTETVGDSVRSEYPAVGRRTRAAWTRASVPPLVWAELLIGPGRSLEKEVVFADASFDGAMSSKVRQQRNIEVVDLTGDVGGESAAAAAEAPIARWVAVQVAPSAFLDCASLMHCSRGGDKAVCCVIAVDHLEIMVDVTPRYVVDPVKLRQCRASKYDYAWLRDYLKDLLNIAKLILNESQTKNFISSVEGDADLTKLDLMVGKVMPNTLAAFKNHEYFAIEKTLHIDEGINPSKRKAVGIFKGNPVYLRECVEQLLSSREWHRMGKRVLTGAAPVKVRGAVAESNSIGLSGKKATNLYGSWQTEQLPRDVAQNGEIPVNDHGNVEVLNYNTSMIPVGTAYVQEEYAEAAAKRLNIPYAKALVGFENKRGRVGMAAFPIFDGIVVLSEHAELVEEISISMLDNKLVNQTKNTESKCVMRWQNLVSGLLTRISIRETYGH